MKIRRAAAGASIAALLPFAGTALAQNAPAGDSNAELRQEIEDQKQRLLVLERKLEIQQEAATAAAATAPRITVNASRFRSAPTTTRTSSASAAPARGQPRVRWRVWRNRRHLHPAPRSPDLRRHVRRHLDFRFTPDFGGGKSISWTLTRQRSSTPGSWSRRGKQAAGGPGTPAERRGHPLHRAWTADQPGSESRSRRAVLGDFSGGAFTYQVGYFNGVTDGQSSDNLATPDGSRQRGRLRRASLLPAVHQLGQLQPARPGHRHWQHLG